MVGNIPNFTKFDVLRSLFRIDENTSRSELVEKLGLGEGTVRTILDMLKEKGFIESTRQGHGLTDSGKGLLKKLNRIMTFPRKVNTPFYKELKQIGLLLKNREKIKKIEWSFLKVLPAKRCHDVQNVKKAPAELPTHGNRQWNGTNPNPLVGEIDLGQGHPVLVHFVYIFQRF